MDTLISDLKFFMANRKNLNPISNMMSCKHILNNPKTVTNGSFILDGSEFNSLVIPKSNFIFLNADANFSILIEDKIVMFTDQFIFNSQETTINCKLYPRLKRIVKVEYIYGLVDYGSDFSPVRFLPNISDSNYDSLLRDMLLKPTLPRDYDYDTTTYLDLN